MTQHPALPLDNECFARKLAEAAGVDWSKLLDYPGYGKNYWREKAHSFLRQK